ncbi:hypothetical protein JOQ06_005469, partial [Pogonophryne albipinna]
SKPILSQVKFNGRTTHPTNPYIQPPLLTQCPSQASQHPASPSIQKKTCVLKLQCFQSVCVMNMNTVSLPAGLAGDHLQLDSDPTQVCPAADTVEDAFPA